MVQLRVVPDNRRDRAREKKRQRFLDAAGAVIDREGLGGVTMQRVADELDCAIGTIYTYFPSKAALVAALQAQAVATLEASHATARARWDDELAGESLEPELSVLVRLDAFGAFFGAAAVVFADEFELQRLLLTERPSAATRAEAREVMPILLRLFEPPRALLAEAVDLEVIEQGDNLDRVVRWLASLDGVLLLDALAPVDRHLFRSTHHARELTHDLLVGWGADRADVEVAASHVDRLAALGPLAPPPEGPEYDS